MCCQLVQVSLLWILWSRKTDKLFTLLDSKLSLLLHVKGKDRCFHLSIIGFLPTAKERRGWGGHGWTSTLCYHKYWNSPVIFRFFQSLTSNLQAKRTQALTSFKRCSTSGIPKLIPSPNFNCIQTKKEKREAQRSSDWFTITQLILAGLRWHPLLVR